MFLNGFTSINSQARCEHGNYTLFLWIKNLRFKEVVCDRNKPDLMDQNL